MAIGFELVRSLCNKSRPPRPPRLLKNSPVGIDAFGSQPFFLVSDGPACEPGTVCFYLDDEDNWRIARIDAVQGEDAEQAHIFGNQRFDLPK